MVRCVLKDGVFVPVDPLPEGWHDGVEVDLRPREIVGADTNGEADDFDEWVRELEELRAQITEEDADRIQAAIEQHSLEAKEWMRRRMESGA